MDSLETTIERYHGALKAFYNGDPGPTKELYSHEPQAIIAGAYGDIARGWDRISNTLDYAVAHFKEGRNVRFENLVTHASSDLAYLVEIERFEAKLGGEADWTAIALRATTIFRKEGGNWKIIHRQGDQLVSRINTATYHALLRAQK